MMKVYCSTWPWNFRVRLRKSMTMIAWCGFLTAMISCGQCTPKPPGDTTIEIAREKREKGELITLCHVDSDVLMRKGVSEEQVRTYVLELLNEVGGSVADAAVEAFTGNQREPSPQSTTPAWAADVFRDGLDLEIVEQDNQGRRTVMRKKIPLKLEE